MKRTPVTNKYEEAAELLDSSYVEMQEHYLIVNQNEEFFYDSLINVV